ncbi:MAG: GumC family protein [Bacteroidia bacterium]
MDLLNFFRVLLRRWWLILGVTALAAGVAFFVSRSKAETYKSQALLSTGITDKVSDGQTWIQQDKVRSEFNNLIKAMTSRPAVSRLSYQLALHDMNSQRPYRDLNMLRSSMGEESYNKAQRILSERYDAFALLDPAQKDDAEVLKLLWKAGYSYEQLMGNLSVLRDGETDYIKVIFASPDPRLSADAANVYSTEFIKYYKDARGEISDEMVKDLKLIAQQRKAEYDQRLADLSALQLKYGIYGSESGSSLVDELLGAEAARDANRQAIDKLEAQLAELNSKLSGGTPGFSTGNTNAKLIDLKKKRDALVDQMNGTNDPNLQASLDKVNDEINNLIASGSRTVGTDAGNVANRLFQQKLDTEVQLRSAQASLSSAQARVRRLKGIQYAAVEGKADYGQAQSAMEAAQKDFAEAQRRYNAGLDNTVDLGKHLKIFEEARAAGNPESRKSMMLVAFSALASLALCVVVLFVMEYVDLSVKTPSQFQRITGLPLLGALNHLNVGSLKLDQLFSDRNSNPSMEKFKQLLRKLRFEVTNNDARTVLVTSAQSGEGKSLTLLSLAYSLSLSGKKILIIDTNFKSASLTALLKAKPTLEDCMGRSEDPTACISRTEYAGLDIIGCQGGDYSPSEVLYEDVFSQMLDRLSAHYDFIFMEGPALNEYADAKELVKFSEKVVAVFSAKSVLRQSDKESIAYLENLGDKFLGTVLNDVDLKNLEL